jgi:hypothetical protein
VALVGVAGTREQLSKIGQVRQRLLATVLAGTALFPFTGAWAATPSTRTLQVSGHNGDSFVIRSSSTWRLDLADATISGGRRFAGLGLELLGHPANDGLTMLVTRMPDRRGGPAGKVSALGATDVTMPPGRYLLVLIGDSRVIVDIPLAARPQITEPEKTRDHVTAFGDATATPTLSPQPTGLYNAKFTSRIPAMNDPIVMTSMSVTEPDAAHTYDFVECVHRGPAACPESTSPSFGTGNRSTGGLTRVSDAFWDGADGLGSNQTWWVGESDYRSSAPGATLYSAFVSFSGGNR